MDIKIPVNLAETKQIKDLLKNIKTVKNVHYVKK